MTVKEVREFIKDIPDDYEFCVEAQDTFDEDKTHHFITRSLETFSDDTRDRIYVNRIVIDTLVTLRRVE